MDQKTIKAVRIVLGYKDDLRIKIKQADKNAIFDFLENNRYGIFGVSNWLSNKPAWNDADFDKWERAMWAEVNAVLSGEANS